MANGKPTVQREGGRVSETRFSLLEQRVGGIDNTLNALTSKIDAWMASRTPRINVWLPSIAIIMGAFWFINSLYIQNLTKPMSDAISALAVTTKTNTDNMTLVLARAGEWTQQNADSKRDRDDQRGVIVRYGEVQTQILANFARADAERQSHELEVETQIDAMNQSLSVQFANQQRQNADFQNALHDLGAKYPTAPGGPFYFPNISNRNHRKGRD